MHTGIIELNKTSDVLQMVVHVVQWLRVELPELCEEISSRAGRLGEEDCTYMTLTWQSEMNRYHENTQSCCI